MSGKTIQLKLECSKRIISVEAESYKGTSANPIYIDVDRHFFIKILDARSLNNYRGLLTHIRLNLNIIKKNLSRYAIKYKIPIRLLSRAIRLLSAALDFDLCVVKEGSKKLGYGILEKMLKGNSIVKLINLSLKKGPPKLRINRIRNLLKLIVTELTLLHIMEISHCDFTPGNIIINLGKSTRDDALYIVDYEVAQIWTSKIPGPRLVKQPNDFFTPPTPRVKTIYIQQKTSSPLC